MSKQKCIYVEEAGIEGMSLTMVRPCTGDMVVDYPFAVLKSCLRDVPDDGVRQDVYEAVKLQRDEWKGKCVAVESVRDALIDRVRELERARDESKRTESILERRGDYAFGRLDEAKRDLNEARPRPRSCVSSGMRWRGRTSKRAMSWRRKTAISAQRTSDCGATTQT